MIYRIWILLPLMMLIAGFVVAHPPGDGSRIWNPSEDTIFYCGNPVQVAPELLIQNIVSKDASEGIKFSVIGYTRGRDTLIYTGDKFTSRWNNNAGYLELLGAGNAADLQEAARQVYYQSLGECSASEPIVFSISLLDGDYLPYTNHFYKYIHRLDVSWTEARDAAAQMQYYGLQGYLATITSSIENDFIWTKIDGVGWIGASDAKVEGDWEWVTGPEAGMIFWRGNQVGSPVGGRYSNWAAGEPNNSGQEHYAHINQHPQKAEKSWNDLKDAGDGPTSQYYRPKGFVVEFGGMEGDPDLQLSASAVVAWNRKPVVEFENFNPIVCGGKSKKLYIKSDEDVSVNVRPLDADAGVVDGHTWQPELVVSRHGDYRFIVEMNHRDMCVYYDTIDVSFRHQPEAEFYIDDEKCRGYNLDMQFTGKVEGEAIYTWYSGDSVFRSGPGLTEVVIPLGYGQRDRTVALEVNERGCRAFYSEPVIVIPKIDMWVEGEQEGCTPFEVHFETTDIEEIDSYYWELGDGTVSNDKSPVHVYQNSSTIDMKPGIKLKIISAEGCENEGIMEDAVIVHPVPSLDMDIKNDECYAGVGEVYYTGSADSYDSFYWDLSDFAAEEIVASPGNSSGPFQYNLPSRPEALVGLQVVSRYGCKTDSLYRTLRRKPLINISDIPVSGCPPLGVQFRLHVTDSIDNIIYTWDMGDGLTLAGEHVAHTYILGNNIYDVAVHARSLTTGCEEELLLKDKVAVSPSPKASYAVNSNEVLISEPAVYFSNRSEGGVYYTWDFGDMSAVSYEENPSHRYLEMGKYEVKLVIENEFGCIDSTFADIAVTFDRIFPPTAFSPNASDAVDHEFRIYADGIVNDGYKLLIFNRWGQMIFQSDSPETGWDGKMKNGVNAPPGVYSWVLAYHDFLGKKHSQQGTVTLIY